MRNIAFDNEQYLKEQSAKIAKEKMDEIFDLLPLLKKELVGERFNAGSDYVKLTFRNGSVFDVVAALDSQRGGRRHFGLVDEVFNCVDACTL